MEAAAVAAGRIRDPDRTVPRASILGTSACAVLYLVALCVVFGVVPNSEPQESNAPFSTAVNTMFGGSWAGYVMAFAVVVSGFGALNGWMMLCGEMPLAAAKDGLFPERFGRLSGNGMPTFGIATSALLASVFTVLSYLGGAGYAVFDTLVFMSGITAAIPFGFSAVAQIKWRLRDGRQLHTPRVARDVVVAVVAVVSSVLFIWFSRNTGEEAGWKVWLPFIFCAAAFLLGIPVYLAQRAQLVALQDVPRYEVAAKGEVTMAFHVDSEVGVLKQVIVHRPGLALMRLTLDNVDDRPVQRSRVCAVARQPDVHSACSGGARRLRAEVDGASHEGAPTLVFSQVTALFMPPQTLGTAESPPNVSTRCGWRIDTCVDKGSVTKVLQYRDQ